MPKKTFRDNPAMAFISTQEPQETQTAQVAQEPPKTLAQTTQGKKGQRLPRITMAFSQQNLEYLQLISRVEGVSSTEYVNRLITADMHTRQDVIADAKKVLK